MSRFVFIFTARAESNILHTVDVESQTKRSSAMTPRDERKYGWIGKIKTFSFGHVIIVGHELEGSDLSCAEIPLFLRGHYLLLGGKSSRNTHKELPPQCCCNTITSHRRSSGNMSFFNCSLGPRNLIVTSAFDCSCRRKEKKSYNSLQNKVSSQLVRSGKDWVKLDKSI